MGVALGRESNRQYYAFPYVYISKKSKIWWFNNGTIIVCKDAILGLVANDLVKGSDFHNCKREEKGLEMGNNHNSFNLYCRMFSTHFAVTNSAYTNGLVI
jgi:hypothetical protein